MTRDPHHERRRHPRSATTFSAELRAGGHRYPARVINLSLGGALLDLGESAAKPEIAVGAPVEVAIRARQERFTVAGKAVLWNTSRGPAPLLAIQFDELTDEAAETLEELLALASIELAR